MPAHLRDGTLDGYCVGEPWNSAAVLARSGWLIATSADLQPGHPEKVLLVQRDFAEDHADEHVALAAALLEACEFCAAPENGARIAETLARREYVNIDARFLHPTFGGGELASGQAVKLGSVFYGDGVNEPSEEKAEWIIEQLQATGMAAEFTSELPAVGARGFRKAIYEQALRLRQTLNAHHEEHPQSAHEPAID
jgi:ABC-type nitrate/sulfonate/bicarbonate transport system substrate-binding protein